MTTVEPLVGRRIELPSVRGPWTEALYGLLALPVEEQSVPFVEPGGGDSLADDDLQMALYLCYELHYAGIVGVDDRMEWSPVVLMLRAALENRFEAALTSAVPCAEASPESVGAAKKIAK